jgi:hypothetical protein
MKGTPMDKQWGTLSVAQSGELSPFQCPRATIPPSYFPSSPSHSPPTFPWFPPLLPSSVTYPRAQHKHGVLQEYID